MHKMVKYALCPKICRIFENKLGPIHRKSSETEKNQTKTFLSVIQRNIFKNINPLPENEQHQSKRHGEQKSTPRNEFSAGSEEEYSSSASDDEPSQQRPAILPKLGRNIEDRPPTTQQRRVSPVPPKKRKMELSGNSVSEARTSRGE